MLSWLKQKPLNFKNYVDKTRIIQKIPMPPRYRLSAREIIGSDHKIRLDVLHDHLYAEGLLEVEAAARILRRGMRAMRDEPNLLRLNVPINIVGDIHGQFYDLLFIFERFGSPANTQYLFLGDYVDRGYFSVECMLYLWALKANYPRNVYLLRGNHECSHLTSYFTFRSECTLKLNAAFYELAVEAFKVLPLAAIVNEQLFCVHGCISPALNYVEEVNSIDRFQEIPSKGLMCDLLWADPSDPFDDDSENMFKKNKSRGCSFLVNYEATCQFLDRNHLLSVVRAHQVMNRGVKLYRNHPKIPFASMITIFSAPNYCDVYGNKGAVMTYDGTVMDIVQYEAKNHPYILPNFLNAFTWSLPFLITKVNDMLLGMLNACDADSESEGPDVKLLLQKSRKLQEKEKKMRDITDEKLSQRAKETRKLNAKLNEVTKQSEMILHLKGITPSDYGTLSGSQAMKNMSVDGKLSFNDAKELDQSNERWIGN